MAYIEIACVSVCVCDREKAVCPSKSKPQVSNWQAESIQNVSLPNQIDGGSAGLSKSYG